MVAKKKPKKKKVVKKCPICGAVMEEGHVCCGEIQEVQQ
jgi:hypothetical protein